MADLGTVLQDLTTLAFPHAAAAPRLPDAMSMGDGILDELRRCVTSYALLRPQFEQLVPALLEVAPDLAVLLSESSTLGPMLMTSRGGTRVDRIEVVAGLCRSAAMKALCFGSVLDQASFTQCLSENLDALRRAVRGERVNVVELAGVDGITLEQGHSLATPWGTLRPVASTWHDFGLFGRRPATSCLLTASRSVEVRFDWAQQPAKHDFNEPKHAFDSAPLLFPLSCALASPSKERTLGAAVAWTGRLLPFQGPGFGFSHSLEGFAGTVFAADEHSSAIESWSQRVHAEHVPRVDVSARRIVSSVARRHDAADALIDAVTVWENLVGTSSEVTYRVSAALAKLLNPGVDGRRELRKQLTKIYDVRSKIVHGSDIDRAKIPAAASDAVDVALRALRASYQRGKDWLQLSSMERSERLWDE